MLLMDVVDILFHSAVNWFFLQQYILHYQYVHNYTSFCLCMFGVSWNTVQHYLKPTVFKYRITMCVYNFTYCVR